MLLSMLTQSYIKLCLTSPHPQTPLRYLKTLLLPINMLVVALIAGRVSPLYFRDGRLLWFGFKAEKKKKKI